MTLGTTSVSRARRASKTSKISGWSAAAMWCLAQPALAAGVPLTAWGAPEGAALSKVMFASTPCGTTIIGSAGMFRLDVVRSPGGRNATRSVGWTPQYRSETDDRWFAFGLVTAPVVSPGAQAAGLSCTDGVPPSQQAAALLPPLPPPPVVAAAPDHTRSFATGIGGSNGTHERGEHSEHGDGEEGSVPPAAPAPTGTAGPLVPSEVGSGGDGPLLGLTSDNGEVPPAPATPGDERGAHRDGAHQVPAPSTAWLLGIGLLGLVRRRARR